MNKKSTPIIWLAIGLILLTISCQTFSDIEIFASPDPTPTPKSWPHSAFVPPHKSAQVFVGQELQIDSYHVSTEKLKKIEIFVNGQRLRTEESGAAGQTDAFPSGLVNVRVRSEDGLMSVSSVEPEIPTAGKKLTLIWRAQVPGVYELSMVATDVTSRTGNTIVQQIEVK